MKVLFVCLGNAFRSPLAEALLKSLRRDITVDSAGTSPASRIANVTKEVLRREGALRFLKDKPEWIFSKKLDEYDLIIAMEEEHRRFIIGKFPELDEKIEVWNIADPYFLPEEEAEEVFQTIKARVKELARKLP